MMDTVNALMQGFAAAITVSNLLWCFVGCALGTAVGVLPGIGPAVAVAMLLPITAKVDITASMIFFAGIYYGAMYGGSTTSILLNTPGETASMVTAMEGNKMAKSGRAGQRRQGSVRRPQGVDRAGRGRGHGIEPAHVDVAAQR